MASAVRASQAARKPSHLREMAGWMASRVRRASVGTARKALAALTATRPPRPVWPEDDAEPAAEGQGGHHHGHRELELIPEQDRDALRAGPVGRGGEPVEHLGEEGHVSRPPAPAPGAGPRDGQALGADEQEVGHGRQGDGEDQADDDRRVVADVEAVGDLLAQAAEADQRGDGDQPDDGRRGHAEPGEDVGQGQGQVDPHQCRGRRVTRARSPPPGRRPGRRRGRPPCSRSG